MPALEPFGNLFGGPSFRKTIADESPQRRFTPPAKLTHAWAQIYLPGTGWTDFDPTSGSVGKIDLVTVAVVRDPHHTIPLHGTFIGFPLDLPRKSGEFSLDER